MTLTIAHRGEPIGHPENTLESLEAAVTAGAAMVEIDVRLTADGVPVLLHDLDLNRVFGDGRALSSITRAQLAEVRTPGGHRVPPLAAAADLAHHAGVQLMVDLPTGNAGPAAHSVLSRQGYTDLALFAGETQALRRHSATARIALTWDRIVPPGDAVLDEMAPEYFNPHFQLFTASVADRMHERSLQVSVWTVDHPRDMAAVLIQGADAIVTNHIAELVALVASGDRRER